MVIMILIGLIVAVCVGIFAILLTKRDWLWPVIPMAFCAVLSVVIIGTAICTRADYNKFEYTYTYHQEYIKNFSMDEDNLFYMADIVEVNTKLAEYKGSRDTWGKLSCIPERVYDIEFIGTP